MPAVTNKRANKRAEARTRYYTRTEAMHIGWDVRHPGQGGSFLEEQEIVDYFPKLASTLGPKATRLCHPSKRQTQHSH